MWQRFDIAAIGNLIRSSLNEPKSIYSSSYFWPGKNPVKMKQYNGSRASWGIIIEGSNVFFKV